jgi:hypothetical protein
VDKIYVPDYALMYVFGTAFSGNFGFGNTNSFNQLKESTDKVDEKEE